MKRLTLAQAEYAAHRLAKELLTYDEPMPDFDTRSPGRLEACLDQPFTTFDKKYLYWTLPHRAAILFYGVVKNHPFENGNKRMAVTLMLVFLYINGKWLRTNPDNLYSIAYEVAESDPLDRDIIITALKINIKKYLVSITDLQ